MDGGRRFSPKGDCWWRVQAYRDHLEGLTGLREFRSRAEPPRRHVVRAPVGPRSRGVDEGRAPLMVATEGGCHAGQLKLGLVGPAVVEFGERRPRTRLVVDQRVQEISVLEVVVEVVGQEGSILLIAADTPLAPRITSTLA